MAALLDAMRRSAPSLLAWLAHASTVARLPLAALFWIVAPRPAYGAAVIAAAALTDLIDGRIARAALRRGARGRVAELGAWLDPLCDKLFAVTVLAALAVQIGTPLWVLVLVGARELVVAPLALVYRVTPLHRRHAWDFHASPAGKRATVAQFVAAGALALDVPRAAGIAVAVIAAALGLVAAAAYVRRAARVYASASGSAGSASGSSMQNSLP